MAETIVELTGSTSRLVWLPLPADDPRQRCPDITLARQALGGWQPHTDLRTGLARTIDHFRARLAGMVPPAHGPKTPEEPTR